MRTANLRSITATHLALAAQCVAFLASQVPVLKAFYASHISSKQLSCLNSFDSLLRDLMNHRQEILAKLSAIVGGLVEGTCGKLLASPWARYATAAPIASAVFPDSNTPPSALAAGVTQDDYDANHVDPCVRLLMKQTAGLHRALTDLLDQKDRDQVFHEVARLFSGICFRYLSRLDIANALVQVRIHANTAFILSSLRELTQRPDVCKELKVFLVLGDADTNPGDESTA